MKKISSQLLLEQLQADVREIIVKTGQLKQLPKGSLLQSPGNDKWSVIEIIDHLNFYSRFYIREIEQQLSQQETQPARDFKPGWLGNYFTRIMKPREGNIISNKMRAPKNAIPAASIDADECLKEFLSHQHHLLNLLQIAKDCNINSIRVVTSLSRWLTLKLGDSFRFLIAHEQRHFVQISHTLKSLAVNPE